MKSALSLALLLAAAACAAAAPAAIEPFLVSFAYDAQEPVIANETNFYHLQGFPGLTARFSADDSCPEADGMTVEEILAAIGESGTCRGSRLSASQSPPRFGGASSPRPPTAT